MGVERPSVVGGLAWPLRPMRVVRNLFVRTDRTRAVVVHRVCMKKGYEIPISMLVRLIASGSSDHLPSYLAIGS